MTETKTFPLEVVLTVTTGVLLTRSKGEGDNGIGDLYEILGWMTSDEPSTHQLGRFAKECKPKLLEWFPELNTVDTTGVSELFKAHGSAALNMLLDSVIADNPSIKRQYDVPKIDRSEHTVVKSNR